MCSGRLYYDDVLVLSNEEFSLSLLKKSILVVYLFIEIRVFLERQLRKTFKLSFD